jgi:hypothetical protein
MTTLSFPTVAGQANPVRTTRAAAATGSSKPSAGPPAPPPSRSWPGLTHPDHERADRYGAAATVASVASGAVDGGQGRGKNVVAYSESSFSSVSLSALLEIGDRR